MAKSDAVDTRSITTILYDEIKASQRVLTDEELVERELRHGKSDAHEVRIQNFLSGGKLHLTPHQQNAYDQIAVADKAQSTLHEMRFVLDRLRRLDVESLRNLTSRERADIDRDYQFYKLTFEKLAQATHYQDVPIMKADPESLAINVKSDGLDLLGFDRFSIRNFVPFLDDDDDDELFRHNVQTDTNAAQSLPILDQALARAGDLSGALRKVEQRMVEFVRNITARTLDTSPLTERHAGDLANRATEQIFAHASRAIDFHSAGPLLGLSLL